jgi:hypothetical protein
MFRTQDDESDEGSGIKFLKPERIRNVGWRVELPCLINEPLLDESY